MTVSEIDTLYSLLKDAAMAPQDTPGGQAMAAAAKMAAPPGAPPMPQPIEPPEQTQNGVDPAVEQQKHLADIAKKDKEISELRTKTQELSLDIKRLQMTSELQKQQQAMLDKVRNEQKLLDKKQTEFTSAEATHKANLEKETARHEVMRAKADAKSLADIAYRDADSIKANAEQNAKNYIKMVEDARKTTDSYMASKEKAFAQTQEAAKKNSPYVSVSLRSNIDGALAAAKNIGKLRSRIAKDDIKFNKIASQGSADAAGTADTNIPKVSTNNESQSGAANPVNNMNLAKRRQARLQQQNSRRYDKAMDTYADKLSFLGSGSDEANDEYQRLEGYSTRADVQADAALSEAVNRAKNKAKATREERKAEEQRIVNDSNASAYARNKAQASLGRTEMASKSYGTWAWEDNDAEGIDMNATLKSDNYKTRMAGRKNTTWAALEAQKNESEENTNRWYHSVGNFLGDMVTGIYTGPRDAIYADMKSRDAANAFKVDRGFAGSKQRDGSDITTDAFNDYARKSGLSQGWGKSLGNVALQTGLALASVAPGIGAVGGALRAGTALLSAAGRQAAVQGIKNIGTRAMANYAAHGAIKGTAVNAWRGTTGALGKAFPSNAQMLGRFGNAGKIAGNTLDYGGGAIFASQVPGMFNSKLDYTNATGYGHVGEAAGSQQDIFNYNMSKTASLGTRLGPYDWSGNAELAALKHRFKNPYNSTTMGRLVAAISPFISQATGGRINLTSTHTIPATQRRPLNVEQAIQDFSTQHWRKQFNPSAGKYPTPMMGHTLAQFQQAEDARHAALYTDRTPRYHFQEKAERIEGLRKILDEVKDTAN